MLYLDVFFISIDGAAFDAAWLQDIESLVARGDQPPFPLDDPLPGSFAVNQPRGDVVTYRVPNEFDEVYHARRYWDQTRDRFGHLRDLADAVGLSVRPVDSHVQRWGGGLPQYAVGHVARVAAVRRALADVPGVAVCGAAYDGVGIPACIASAYRAVDEVLGSAETLEA